MKNSWCRCVLAAAAAIMLASGVETVDARTALRGLAVAHGGHEDDGHEHDHAHESEKERAAHGPFSPAHAEDEGGDLAAENTADWKELKAAAHDIQTRDSIETGGEGDLLKDDKTTVGADADADADANANADSDSETDADSEDATPSTSFGFDEIGGEAMHDDVATVVAADIRGASGGYNSENVVQKANPAVPPMSESAAAAKPISEIDPSAIQKDPEGYGVKTAAPTTPQPPPMSESAAAAKPISEIDPSAIQKDPEGYGVVTKPPTTTSPSPVKPAPFPIGESAAAAKPITDISASAIQRDPKSYGVVTPAPGTTTAKLSDTAAAAKPSTPAPAGVQSPTQRVP